MGDIDSDKRSDIKRDSFIAYTKFKNLLIVEDTASGKSTVLNKLFVDIVENTNLVPLLFDENCQFDDHMDYKYLSRRIRTFEFGMEGYNINPLELINEATSEQRFASILAGIFEQYFNRNRKETFILE